MARGWESKSVEWQQSETRTERERGNAPSREEVERTQRRDSLELQRRRIAHDLEISHSEVHRTALQNALRFLDDALGKLR